VMDRSNGNTMSRVRYRGRRGASGRWNHADRGGAAWRPDLDRLWSRSATAYNATGETGPEPRHSFWKSLAVLVLLQAMNQLLW